MYSLIDVRFLFMYSFDGIFPVFLRPIVRRLGFSSSFPDALKSPLLLTAWYDLSNTDFLAPGDGIWETSIGISSLKNFLDLASTSLSLLIFRLVVYPVEPFLRTSLKISYSDSSSSLSTLCWWWVYVSMRLVGGKYNLSSLLLFWEFWERMSERSSSSSFSWSASLIMSSSFLVLINKSSLS